MKQKALGILLVTLGCGAGVAFMSCDNSTTNPGAPTSSRDNGKGVRVLTDCLNVFPGIENCSLGGAEIEADGSTVVATGMNGLADGVSGSFGDAAAWSQDIAVDFGPGTGSLRYSASSEGQILGQLNIDRLADGKLSTTALYSGEEGAPSAYSVYVFNNNAMVASQTGIPGGPDGGPTIFNGIISHAGFGNVGPQYPGPVLPGPDEPPHPWPDGACVWTLNTSSSFIVNLPDGTIVNGDEIAFVEDVTPGHAVYSHFQRVDVQGQMSSYTIYGESSTSAGD
jgi:hypothetical protein